MSKADRRLSVLVERSGELSKSLIVTAVFCIGRSLVNHLGYVFIY